VGLERTDHERLVSFDLTVQSIQSNQQDRVWGLPYSNKLRYGTYSTAEAVNAGLDLEMPGPTRFRGQLITHAIMANKITRQTLDARVREVLKLVSRVARSGVSENALEGSRDIPETGELLRKIAGESIVLLKNENKVLPLDKSKTVSGLLKY
jgi:beta-glucosidase